MQGRPLMLPTPGEPALGNHPPAMPVNLLGRGSGLVIAAVSSMTDQELDIYVQSGSLFSEPGDEGALVLNLRQELIGLVWGWWWERGVCQLRRCAAKPIARPPAGRGPRPVCPNSQIPALEVQRRSDSTWIRNDSMPITPLPWESPARMAPHVPPWMPTIQGIEELLLEKCRRGQ